MLPLAQFPRPARTLIRLLWGRGAVSLGGISVGFRLGPAIGYGNPPPLAIQGLYVVLCLVPAALFLWRRS